MISVLYALILFVVVLIIYRLYYLYKTPKSYYKVNKNNVVTPTNSSIYDNYKNLTGDTKNQASEKIINDMSIGTYSPLDHYFVGVTQLVTYKDYKKANYHFNESLKGIANFTLYDKACNELYKFRHFIIDGIENFRRMYPDKIKIESGKIVEDYKHKLDERKTGERKTGERKTDLATPRQQEPTTRQTRLRDPLTTDIINEDHDRMWDHVDMLYFMNLMETDLHNEENRRREAAIINMENRMRQQPGHPGQQPGHPGHQPQPIQHTPIQTPNPVWISDSQNVHDSNINTQLNTDFQKLQLRNLGNTSVDYYDARDSIIQYYQNLDDREYPDKAEKLRKVREVLGRIERNDLVNGIIKSSSPVGERDILESVWKRAYSPENEHNQENIQTAVCASILDCYENGPVCQTGRVSKIMSALATLDDSVGVYQSKQVVRNSMYDEAARIVHNKLKITPEDIKQQYIDGTLNEDTHKLIFSMKDEITALGDKYKDKLPPDQINNIIQECYNTI